MADIVYAFDLDAGVTTIAAESTAGSAWLGRCALTIPNIDFPGYRADILAAGLLIAPLATSANIGSTTESYACRADASFVA